MATATTAFRLTIALLCAAPAAAAGTLTTLHSFTGGADGAVEFRGVSIDSNDTIYGVTTWGADATCTEGYEYPGIGCGTLFKRTSAGAFSTLVTFHGASNGASPIGNVAVNGTTLYGSAYTGGANNLGVMYQVRTNGTGFRVIHTFAGTEGSNPNSFPRLASDGLYSVARFGGPAYNGTAFSGFGALFRIDTTGHYIPEHFFSGGADGGNPGRVFLDSSGTITGSTDTGGACTGTGLPANGCGTIYSFVPATGVFTTLHTFSGGGDGYLPYFGGPDKKGNLFGATYYGGQYGYGTLFELVKSGTGTYTYQRLHDFTGGADGANPSAPPQVTATGLNGTTVYGPITGTDYGAGVLYQYADGTVTPLQTFTGDANGGYPEGTPVSTSTGALVGTAAFGGIAPCDTTSGALISSYGCGTLYQVTP